MVTNPLFMVFLDLSKAYDNVDRYCLLIKLKGYGAGPRMCGILETFWDCQKVVPSHNSFHGTAFPSTRGTTQGGLVPPKLFNVVVDNVIRTCLAMTVEDQRVTHDRLEETVGRCLGVLYADYGLVVSCDLDWLQHTINDLVGLFIRYGLVYNVTKSCKITCQTGALRAGISEDAMALK